MLPKDVKCGMKVKTNKDAVGKTTYSSCGGSSEDDVGVPAGTTGRISYRCDDGETFGIKSNDYYSIVRLKAEYFDELEAVKV